MFSSFVSLIDSVVDSASQAAASLQVQAPEIVFTARQTYELISFLRHALKLGDPMWPHTPSQGDLVVENLRLLAKAVHGAKEDPPVIEAFFNQRGLCVLVDCLLTYQTADCIRAQAWQSLCLILQNVEDDVFQELVKLGDLNRLFAGEPDLSVEENLQFFASAMKSVAMRTRIETAPWLLMDKDIPILQRALSLTSHEESIVRTQTRAASLMLFNLFKDDVLQIAIDTARTTLPSAFSNILWKNWSKMATACSSQNKVLFRVAAEAEEDLWEHVGDLFLLQVPEMSELVADVVVANLACGLAKLEVNLPPNQGPAVNAFGDFDWEPLPILPSPTHMSPKSQIGSLESHDTESTRLPEPAACDFAAAVQSAQNQWMTMSSNISAVVLRAVATFARSMRQAGLCGAVMPLVELLLMPSAAPSVLQAISDLGAGNESEGAALSKQMAASALEDCALRAWGDQQITSQYWQQELRSAFELATGPRMVPNPFRAAFLVLMDAQWGFSPLSLPLRAPCHLYALESAEAESAATLTLLEFEALFPKLFEDLQLLESEIDDSPVVMEDERKISSNLFESFFGSFGESLSSLFQASSNTCPLVSSL